MDQSKELFDKIAHDLAADDSSVKPGKLFGSPCIKTNGKAFATYSKEGDLVVKLMGKSHAHALGLAGAKLFDPGMGRAMKEWVQVPFTHAAEWPDLAADALEYVTALQK